MKGFVAVRWDNHSQSWRPLGQPTDYDHAQRRAAELGRRWITVVRRVASRQREQTTQSTGHHGQPRAAHSRSGRRNTFRPIDAVPTERIEQLAGDLNVKRLMEA